MNKFDFKEFRILRCPHRGKYGNLTMTIEFQETDAPLELELYYRKCWQDGITLKADVKEIDKEVYKNTVSGNPVLTKESIQMQGRIAGQQFPEKGEIIKTKNPPSIYQEFKWFCERVGKDYEIEKKEIFIKEIPNIEISTYLEWHMKDLEDWRTLEEIGQILKNRIAEINEEMGFYNEQTT